MSDLGGGITRHDGAPSCGAHAVRLEVLATDIEQLRRTASHRAPG